MDSASQCTSERQSRALVRMACGRIVGFANAIREAHELGVAEGPHELPWGAEYQREAVRICAATLPIWYQLYVGEFFRCSSEFMAGETIPGDLAEDWMIIRSYMDSLSNAIWEHYAAPPSQMLKSDVLLSEEVAFSESLPMVIRFDLLAELASSEGARRLEHAAIAVRDQMETPLPALEDIERHMLTRLTSGIAIVDIASEMGYSERSMYRSLARLWEKLGVSGRKEGIRRAAEGGILN